MLAQLPFDLVELHRELPGDGDDLRERMHEPDSAVQEPVRDGLLDVYVEMHDDVHLVRSQLHDVRVREPATRRRSRGLKGDTGHSSRQWRAG